MNFNFNMDLNFLSTAAASFDRIVDVSNYPKPFKAQVEAREWFFNTSGVHLLLGSRGYGKTDYITILGCVYELSKNPQLTILYITKERDRGLEICQAVRDCLKKAGVKIKNKSRSKIYLVGNEGKEPNFIVMSIRSRGLRGRHPQRVILEDIITPDDDSAAERKKTKKTYEEVVKLTDWVGIIGQPVHPMDLYQELRGRVPTLEMPIGTIPELDTDINALRAARVSEYSIQASYYLNIMDSEQMPLKGTAEVDYFAKSGVMWIDPSHKGKDYTAAVIGGMHNGLFVLTGFCFRRAWYDCLDILDKICRLYNGERVVIETNGLGELPVNELRARGAACVGFNTTINKHSKIMNMASFKGDFALCRVYEGGEIGQANDLFIDNFKNWEYNAEHDDAADAAASLINYMRGL